MQLAIKSFLFMSFFDPQQVYYHRQKSTRKGQVLQQKPEKKISAINEDMVPSAINILRTYGYYISKNPPATPPAIFFLPFTLHTELSEHASNLRLNTMDVWGPLKRNFASLREFINANQNKEGNILIGISSMLFYYQGDTSGPIPIASAVYANNEMNFEISPIPTTSTRGAFLLGAPNNNYICWSYDTDIGNSSPHDARYGSSLRPRINYGNTLCYASYENRWHSFATSEELPPEDNYSINHTWFYVDTENTRFFTTVFSGYIFIQLH